MSLTALALLAGLLAADPEPTSGLPVAETKAPAAPAGGAASAVPEISETNPDAEPADHARMCRETICQHDVTIRLLQADGDVWERTFPEMPGVVQGETLMILPGQTLYIEVESDDDGPTAYRAVDAVRDPAITLTASFTQADDGTMMLHLKNPFPRSLKFDMGYQALGGDRLRGTSSCPVRGGLGLYELWHEPIVQLLMTNGRFVDDGDASVCD